MATLIPAEERAGGGTVAFARAGGEASSAGSGAGVLDPFFAFGAGFTASDGVCLFEAGFLPAGAAPLLTADGAALSGPASAGSDACSTIRYS